MNNNLTETTTDDKYIQDNISVIGTELLLVGSYYKEPDLYIKTGGYSIRSQYDFFDPCVRFFYDCFEEMYVSYSQEFTLANINAFMSQDLSRYNLYKQYNGYKTISTWMDMTNTKDCLSYLSQIKKYSLLRELYRKGYNVEYIKKFKNFDRLQAQDIIKIAKQDLDNISTVILSDDKVVDISCNAKEHLLQCVSKPDIGLMTPYPIYNEVIRGLRTESFLVTGMLSNEGKTRFLAKLSAHTAFVCKEKVLVMLNETTEEEFNRCLITTLLNNKEFYKLHGVNIQKIESEISMGEYRDEKGEIIKRHVDENGIFTENETNFINRLYQSSIEFKKVLKVASYLQEELQDLLYIKVMEDYSDQALEIEIQKNIITKGIKYYFYDTLKNDIKSIGDWASLKKTVTKLSEIVKKEKIFLYGSIQLTDDAKHLKVEDLTSNNIANAKQLKHVVDHLFFFKEIPRVHFSRYKYITFDSEWGENSQQSLDENKRYYGCITDKNRQGSKPNLIFEVDLNLNTWKEKGFLVVSQNIL